MSFNSTPPRAEYVATAGQTVFPFLFKVYEETDIVVYQETAPAEPVLLLLTTDYTVTIDGDNGGEITLVSSATLDDNITILRSLPLTRDVEYQTSGDLLADTLNLDQEYQTYLIADQLDRTTALEAGDAGVSSFVQRSGDTMTGQLKGITPVDANDMTRKDYVDGEIATVNAAIALKAPITSPAFLTGATLDGNDLLADEAKSLAANGYQKLSNGLIMQWGISASIPGNSTGTVTFPITFPTACFQVVTAQDEANIGATDGNSTDASNITTTGFDASVTDSVATAVRFFAIGH